MGRLGGGLKKGWWSNGRSEAKVPTACVPTATASTSACEREVGRLGGWDGVGEAAKEVGREPGKAWREVGRKAGRGG